MEPKVIRDLCIGCGACESLCPEVFQADDEGISTVIGPVTETNRVDVIQAAEACPTSAIIYEGYQK